MIKVLAAILMFVMMGVFAGAQTPEPVPPVPPIAMTDMKITGGLSLSGRSVKNAPFSAEAISESVQVLADGNRIVRSSTSKLYRNSEGRFRREMSGGTGGVLGSYFSYGDGVTIMNPGQGQIFLDSDSRIARVVESTIDQSVRVVAPAIAATGKVLEAYTLAPEAKIELDKMKVELDKVRAAKDELRAASEQIATTVTAAGVGFGVGQGVGRGGPKWESRTEDLGEQNIEGVSAHGTRTTTTIPAGAIGNERSIEMVYEKWFSKELQMVVYSKNTDPRFGEQTYRLTNINRTEPDPSLFQPPAGYKISRGHGVNYTYTTKTTPAQQAERTAAAKAAQSSGGKTKNQQ